MTVSGVATGRPGRDALAEGISTFAEAIAAAYAQHPGFATMSYPEQRRVAEIVRAPWRAGGPAMSRITELQAPGAAGPVRVRIYAPEAARETPTPALIYLHGGGWTYFSLDTHDRVMREYAARAGVVVVGIDYPLSPEAKFPRALDDVVAVTRWLAREGRALGVRPDRLAIGGDSAGANLALSACLVLRDAGEAELIRAMLLNYGAFDPVSSDEAERRNGGADAVLNRAEMDVFWANYLAEPQQAQNPFAAPLRANLQNLPPAFLAIPERDLLAEQSMRLSERLSQAGVVAQPVVYRGATHSFLEAMSVAPVADRALGDGADWLKTRLCDALAAG